jgi:hypothetical protein
MTDDPFFQRLRNDARPLRHQPDDATLARIRANIEQYVQHGHLQRSEPTVAQLLAAWFRPLVASAAALALVAAIGTSILRSNEEISIADSAIEITVGGETWRVGD